MTAPKEGLRFSLRTMLITLLGLGVYFGVMGRLLIRNPQVFYRIWTITTTLVPFVLAIGLLLWVSQGHKNKRQIRFWAIFLGVSPILGLIALPAFHFFQSTVGTRPAIATAGPQDYATIASPLLIANYLPTKVDEPWVWNELEDRANAGKLSAENADAALQVFVKHLQLKTGQPHMAWQRGFLKSIQQNNLVAEKQLIPLHDVFIKKPVLDLDRIRETDDRMGFEVRYGENLAHSNLPFALVWNIKSIEIDASPPKIEQSYRHAAGNQSGTFTGKWSAGEHEIKFVIVAAYVPEGKMIGLNAARIKPSNWPKPVKKWEETISRKFVVHAEDEQVVKLSNDPNLNPKLAVNAQLTVQNSGQQNKIILEIDMKDPPISCSFDCSVIVNDEELPIGSCFYIRTKNGSTTSGGTLTGEVAPLPENVIDGTIVLTPNPAHVTEYGDVKEIWGKKIILQNIELRRFDLEAGQQ